MQIFLRFLLTAALTACATTGSTFGSGVGDTFLEHPPYSAGNRGPLSDARIGVYPILYQRGATHAASFDPDSGRGTQMHVLLADMNAWLDSFVGNNGFVRLAAAPGTPPDVRFGCDALPGEDCPERGDSALGRGYQAMRLAVGRPSSAWVAATYARLAEQGADYALVITIETGSYLLRQDGWRGTKVLELGTGHRATLPWLTSLETPVSVLQVTGALINRDGKAVRIGAEGFLARRTALVISAMGGQEIITDQEATRARDARRDDLPGQPLAWKVALEHLVRELTRGA